MLADARINRPILLHGFYAAVWHFVRRAREQRSSTRVGLEDGLSKPDGTLSIGNADLVAAAVAYSRE